MKATTTMIATAKQASANYDYYCHKVDEKAIVSNGVVYPVETVNYSDCNSFAEYVYRNKINVAIATHCVKNLAMRGNTTAWDLLLGYNKTVSMEDLSQDVMLAIIECYDSNNVTMSTDSEKLDFTDTGLKTVFGVVSRTLYQMADKHSKRLYIEIDGKEINTNSVPELSTVADIDAIEGSVFWKEFSAYIEKTEKKQGKDLLTFLSLRLRGYTYTEAAEAMNVSTDRVKYLVRIARSAYTDFMG